MNNALNIEVPNKHHLFFYFGLVFTGFGGPKLFNAGLFSLRFIIPIFIFLNQVMAILSKVFSVFKRSLLFLEDLSFFYICCIEMIATTELNRSYKKSFFNCLKPGKNFRTNCTEIRMNLTSVYFNIFVMKLRSRYLLDTPPRISEMQ